MSSRLAIVMRVPTLALLLIGLGLGTGQVQAQETVSADEAGFFIGDWQVTLDAEQPIDLELSIHEENGQVAARINRPDGSSTEVEKIATRGQESLVLHYALDVQGQTAPIQMTITPETHTGNLLVEVDVAEGMAVLEGTAASAQRSRQLPE